MSSIPSNLPLPGVVADAEPPLVAPSLPPAPQPNQLEPFTPRTLPMEPMNIVAAEAGHLPDADLARGAHGPEVAQLQDTLVARGHLSAEVLAHGRGTFGPATEAALVALQRELGVKADGVLGPRTRWAFEGPSASPVEVARAAVGLSRGDRGPAVEHLQRALVQAGQLTEADVASGPGLFGPRTEAALEHFRNVDGGRARTVHAEVDAGNFERALALIEQAFTHSGGEVMAGRPGLAEPERAALYLNQAQARLQLGDEAEARISMQKLNSADPGFVIPTTESPKLRLLLDEVRLAFQRQAPH